MRAYQERYVENLKELALLNAADQDVPEDINAFLAEHRRNTVRVGELVQENTVLLRQNLFPVLDDIVSAGEEEIAQLEEFAGRLGEGGPNQLDLGLNYSIRSALIAYARKWKKRDMLIRELYHTGMALFYMQELIGRSGKSRYQWKMGMMFGEAASYIKQYDEIEDPETRGFIHRAMGNLALSYSGLNAEDGERKLNAVRRSLQILEDPVYQAKTPSLPWDLFIYKSHQERSTALGLLRAGTSDPKVLREVMESAQYIRERQMESAEKRGTRLLVRWQMVYEAVQYHAGIRPLTDLLQWFEKTYLERDENDYSEDGIYCNVFIPALYADYLEHHPEFRMKKQLVLSHMYCRLVEYARNMPSNQMGARLQNHLVSCLLSFIEYPGGLSRKEFLLQLVVCRDPDAYVLLRMIAQIAEMMTAKALRERPEVLLGVLDCESVEELRRRETEVRRFAFDSGMLHDVGMLAFSNRMRRIGRSWLEEEREMYQYHVYAGEKMLSQSESTRPFAPIALGHHRYYNSEGGYPAEYDRKSNPNRAMTDLVGAAALLIHLIDDMAYRNRESLTLDQALAQVRRESGSNVAPFAAELLLDMRPELEAYLENGQAQAYEEAFRLLRGQAAGNGESGPKSRTTK